ncbi:histidine phosphatase family protein [Methyloceanibacter sp.]|uniref:histidine phosphatase family protein n=1 Tax=Methyloceanibacter sp. TaxID=1965321 RepID=UPI003D6D8F78
MVTRLALIALLCCCQLDAALAAPSRIIILRHGEKDNVWKLCGVGQERADALAANYLGRNAANSLFAAGEEPAAILAITLHTLELAAPAAASWELPVTLYSVVPDGTPEDGKDAVLNRRTQEAAHDIASNPEWQGKTVVMVWEHKHIASDKLERAFPGKEVTLRQLLGLDKLKDVPETWPSGNYDYFWIVDYAGSSAAPTGFRMVKQVFDGRYAKLPTNEWGAPNGLTAHSKCDLKGAE